jgi:predicted nucleic acid-binding protein
MRAIVDTNIILDILYQREPFAEAAAAIWLACEQGLFEGYVSAITPVNIFYIARKHKNSETARQLIVDILTVFHVCPIDHNDMQAALALPIEDYEDAVQVASAQANKLDVIVTRNIDDFEGSKLPVHTPIDFLERLAQ